RSIPLEIKNACRTFFPAYRPLVMMATRPTFMTIYHLIVSYLKSHEDVVKIDGMHTLHGDKVPEVECVKGGRVVERVVVKVVSVVEVLNSLTFFLFFFFFWSRLLLLLLLLCGRWVFVCV